MSTSGVTSTDVRLLSRDEIRNPAIGRDRALDDVQRARHDGRARHATERAAATGTQAESRAPARRTLAQRMRVLVLGRAVPHVVRRRPHAARQPEPETPWRLLAKLAVRDVRVVVGQLPQQASVAELVLHHEDEMDVMPALRQLADGRREVSERAGVAHGEQDLHVTTCRSTPLPRG